MACGELNGHAIDDVKGHGHEPNALIEPNTSKTAGDAILQQSLITRQSIVKRYTVGYPSDSLASCFSGK